jgi:hypothetical protein
MLSTRRRLPMKTFVLACLLAVTAASGVVVTLNTADAGRPDVIIVGGSNVRGR